MTAALRSLPAVHEVADALGDLEGRFPRPLMVREIRAVLASERTALSEGRLAQARTPAQIAGWVLLRLQKLEEPSLRRVINATGVVLHTNLGRAPLGSPGFAAHYANLEYDIETGRRGKRDTHVDGLIESLLGVPGIAVNNNAAAVYLVLNELAFGGEVIVSRGELIEIGDGFRIPDIMARSGAIMREVGTTNRTSLADYRDAIGDRTRLILIVHPSNFRIRGFTAKPSRSELVELGRERGIAVYEDLGSGCLAGLAAHGIEEPRVQDAVAAGVPVVSFSGDKLLGGPQAGIIAGEPGLVARIRRNPMFRALRLDKLILAALEQVLRNTLLERWDEIPAIRMIRLDAETIKLRASCLLARARVPAEVIAGESVIGGGSTPEQAIPTWLVAVEGNAPALEKELRQGAVPVIARIENDRVVLDLRTVAEDEEEETAAMLAAAYARSR